MRHGKKIAKLGRTSAHRKAMLSNMATSLILHKRINTTVPKAKALRKYIEPLITRSKTDDTHSRRMVFRKLKNKEGVKELFDNIATVIADRPGGYTRILRTGFRQGDNAEMCIIELVDYNESYTQNEGKKKSKRKRTRRTKKSSSESAAVQAESSEEVATGEGEAEGAAPEATASETGVSEAKAENTETSETKKEDAAPSSDEEKAE